MRNPERFPKDARVMFIGDSITCNGTFIAHIQEYYMTRFPADRVKLYNAGVSGGNVWGSALRYLEADLALFEPTHAVLMIGMNDIWRGHYMAKEHYTDIKTERNRLYFEGVALLAEKLYERGIPLIFCTPTPFDDEMACEAEAGKNLAMALTGYGHFCAGLAEKYGAPVVDFNSAMTFFNRERQKKDPAFSLVGADRVHPTAEGHAFMASVFLRAQGFTDLPEVTVEAYEKSGISLSLSSKNTARFEVEKKLRTLRCAAYFSLGDKWNAPYEERLAIARDYIAENKGKADANAFVLGCVETYLENVPHEEEYTASLLRLTDALYEGAL